MKRASQRRTRLDPHSRVTLYDHHPAPSDLRAEVPQGLSQTQKCLSAKFFFDRKGSRLFDAITEVPE